MSLSLCVGVHVHACGIPFPPQDLFTASSRLAAAKPVWPVWTEDRGTTQSPPQSTLWDWRQPRGHQSSIRWPSSCKGNSSCYSTLRNVIKIFTTKKLSGVCVDCFFFLLFFSVFLYFFTEILWQKKAKMTFTEHKLSKIQEIMPLPYWVLNSRSSGLIYC